MTETKTKFYVNVYDLAEIPKPLMRLVIHDWFDSKDMLIKANRIDDAYVRVIGNDMNQIESRVELLKTQKRVRNGGGVRIKEV